MPDIRDGERRAFERGHRRAEPGEAGDGREVARRGHVRMPSPPPPPLDRSVQCGASPFRTTFPGGFSLMAETTVTGGGRRSAAMSGSAQRGVSVATRALRAFGPPRPGNGDPAVADRLRLRGMLPQAPFVAVGQGHAPLRRAAGPHRRRGTGPVRSGEKGPHPGDRRRPSVVGQPTLPTAQPAGEARTRDAATEAFVPEPPDRGGGNLSGTDIHGPRFAWIRSLVRYVLVTGSHPGPEEHPGAPERGRRRPAGR